MWPEILTMLPPNAGIAIVDDDAKNYQKRLSLLLSNAFLGLLLILIIMSLFLQFKLAFWVVAGIPSSFLGAMLFLPSFDVSINMVSMFANIGQYLSILSIWTNLVIVSWTKACRLLVALSG